MMQNESFCCETTIILLFFSKRTENTQKQTKTRRFETERDRMNYFYQKRIENE